MKNWKEHPHLFANGKFEVRVKLNDDRIVDTKYSGVNEAKVKKFEIRNVPQTIYPYKILKLIARPIEDITDKEVSKLLYWDTWVGEKISHENAEIWRKQLKRQVSSNGLTINSFLYLLSIGCYPFPDTEDVIFKPK